ncbi:hypothetical protein DFH08DRAFT_1072643 [Mycena albidolilacea]|uniref:Uncharacterized protein n=1 Tax=Mycena albidolilacea TaxID=1033008 RepID=A0AAD7F5W5_9AGAR|nr:hypothetical protein DFH08DRAFT_1072643 [Mycena albidolilacea]
MPLLSSLSFDKYLPSSDYLATLVNLMQQLSLRRNLNIRQTVTAFHDKHAAWAGPGEALTALHRQSHLRTAFSGLFFVTLYLFGASALHITTPSSLSLFSGNKTSAGYASLDSSHPHFLSPLISPSIFSNGIPVLPMLGLMQKANATLGLHGNILSDVPRSIYQAYYDRPPAQKFQNPKRNCFQRYVRKPGRSGTMRNVTDGNYRPLRVFTPYGIRFIPQEYMVEDQALTSQTLLLVASVNITDNEGHNGSTFAVDPSFNPLPSNWFDSFVQDRPKTFDPVVIACSLASSSPGITLDPISINITQGSIAVNPRKTHRVWSVWTEPPRSDEPLIQSWASIFLDTSTSPDIATTCDDPHLWPNRDNLCQMNDYLTVVERYVNDRLGIRPWSESSSTVYNTSVNLHDLENVLEDLTAAVFWGAANFPGTKLDSAELRDLGNVVNVTTYESNVQLTINETPLLVGLLCSVGLLCIALYLVRWPRETQIGTELDMVQFI